MKQTFSFKARFAFKPVTKEFVKSIVNSLSRNKAADGDILINLLKENTFVLPYLVHCVNEALVKSEFPDPPKLRNIVPVHKKENPTDKTNYRPVIVLPLLSKVFEKVVHEQLYEYLNHYLNDLLRVFPKADST